jgi:hypothetical protein
VQATFSYLYTSACYRLRNTLLVSYALRETAENSLVNRFLKFLPATLSRCAGYQKCQQIFGPSGHFLNFGKSQKTAAGEVT